jgi:uncharacterized phage protein (TIGR01671 family)
MYLNIKEHNMRELKFRVWDVKLNEYVPKRELDRNFGLDFNGELRCLIASREKDPFILQQYTGLTDKNGKEIYEGDIINLKFGELNANLVVKWDKYMGLKYHNGGWTSLVHVDTHGEVIGNIFEHENLLN